MRLFFGLGLSVFLGVYCWPFWSPSVFTLLYGITAYVILIVFLRHHWWVNFVLFVLAFLLGSLRCSSIAKPVFPEEGSFIGVVRTASGKRAIVENTDGRLDLNFYPSPPPKGSLVAVWFDSRVTEMSWPGGVNHSVREVRSRVARRRAVDWQALHRPSERAQPVQFSWVKYGSIMWAFSSGQRNTIPQEMKRLLRRTGTSHLLAISGMHIGLISGWVFFLSKIILSPLILISSAKWIMKVPILLAVGFAFFYAEIVGWPASAKRSVVMIAVFSFGKLFNIDVSIWDLLGIAAMVILFHEPAEIHDLGFLLSFSSVMGIVWFLPFFQSVHIGNRLLKSMFLSIGVSIGAALGSLPVSGWAFQAFPWICPLSNLVATPLIGGIAVPSAMLASITTGWCSNILLSVGNAAIEISVFVLRLIDVSPLIVAFDFADCILVVVVLFLIRIHCVFVLLLLPFYRLNNTSVEDLEIQFLPMGQGESSLIRWPDGTNWLIDAGPFSFELVPYLRREGVFKLDMVVLSHPHPDHMAALFAVFEELSVDSFLTVRPPQENETQYQELWELIDRNEVPILYPSSPVPMNFKIHHPLENWKPTTGSVVNEQSLVFEINYGEHRFLFTGDIEKQAEKHLNGRVGKIDVLKVPHHGSKTSTTFEFISELQPRYSIISCGRNNYFAHPHYETLWNLRHSRVLRTDQFGVVVLQSNGKEIFFPELSQR